MKITDDHWLEGATRILIKGGSPMNVRRFLVMHFTAGATALSSIRFWQTPAAQGASAHLVIDRDGTIYQCRPFNVTCGHAGVSSWVDPNTGKKYTGLNSCSIGIELANAGDNAALAKKWSELPLAKHKHKNGGACERMGAISSGPAHGVQSCLPSHRETLQPRRSRRA